MGTTAASSSAQTEGIPLPAPNAPEPLSMKAVLAIAPMRRLWYAQIVSVFGDFLALFAVITVMTFQLHATARQITGIQIAYMLPIAVLGILSGVFVDRWPVKPTLVSSDFVRAGLCLLLLAVHSAWGFYAVLASISVVSSFFGPAQGVAIRSIVPMHGLRSANSLIQQVMFIMRVIGGPIAAALVSWFGAFSCYLIDTVSFVISGLLIASLALTLPRKSAVVQEAREVRSQSAVVVTEKTGLARVWADMQTGISFIVHHAALLFVIVAMAAAMFVMGCFGPLIAVYVRDTLHASTKTFGVTSAMIGVGLLLGINGLNAFGKKLSHTLMVYSGLGLIALGTLLLAALPRLAAAIPGLFIIGFGVAGVIVPSQTMIQQETPPAMLGRVGSTVMSLIFSAQIAGLVLSGLLVAHISVRGVFGVCAGMLLLLIIAGKVWMEPKPAVPQTV